MKTMENYTKEWIEVLKNKENLIKKNEFYIYARKGQNKIFEERIDSVDAIIPEAEIENFCNLEAPRPNPTWDKVGLGWKYNSYTNTRYMSQEGKIIKKEKFFPQSLNPNEFMVENWHSPAIEQDKREGLLIKKFKVILYTSAQTSDLMYYGREATVQFYWDGKVSLTDKSCREPKYYGLDNDPFYNFFSQFGIEIIKQDDNKPKSEKDWYDSEFTKMVDKYRPSPNEQKQTLDWLYQQGWNKKMQETPPLGEVYIPASSTVEGLEDVQWIKVLVYQGLEEWENITAELHQGTWNLGELYLDGKIPPRQKDNFRRIDHNGNTINKRWELVGYGFSRTECDSIHQKMMEMNNISSTGVILTAKSIPTTNLVGR